MTKIQEAKKEAKRERRFLEDTFIALKHLHLLVRKAKGNVRNVSDKKAKREIKHIWRKLRSGIFSSEERVERELAYGYKDLIGKIEKITPDLSHEESDRINSLMKEGGVFNAVLKKLGSRGGEIEKALEEAIKHPKNIQKLNEVQKLIGEALEAEQSFQIEMSGIIKELSKKKRPKLRLVSDPEDINTELILNFDDFMNKDFKSISLGFSPSGHIHLGFLTTLACAFMYLKEHPGTHLTIANIKNCLSDRVSKYQGVPLRYQYIREGKLYLPTDYREVKRRNTAGFKVQSEVTTLIWQLASIFDKKTKQELRLIKKNFIPPKAKRWLQDKENSIVHLFGNQIYIYSFLKVLEKDRTFRRKLVRLFMDIRFAKVAAVICNFKNLEWKNFGDVIHYRKKRYQPKCYQVPIRLFCPNCYQICKNWAVVVFGHPEHTEATFAAPCLNTKGECPRALKKPGYDGYVYRNLVDDFHMVEFHYLLDPIRDFFNPFKADCHIFGGDYFQSVTGKGQFGAQKIMKIFDFVSQKTGQKKFIFGGPLITKDGKKMSKTGEAFNVEDIHDIKKVFVNIVDKLEESRVKSYSRVLKIEYTELMEKVYVGNRSSLAISNK